MAKTVDETPESGNLDAPFGTYRVSYKVDNGVLVFTRSLEVKAATIPASGYSQVRDFFGRSASPSSTTAALDSTPSHFFNPGLANRVAQGYGVFCRRPAVFRS